MSATAAVDRDLGVLSEALRGIQTSLDDMKTDNKEARNDIVGLDKKLDRIDWRVGKLEEELTTMSPKVAEFARITQQVEGAGWLGATLWKVGGVLIAGAAGAWTLWSWFATHLSWK